MPVLKKRYECQNGQDANVKARHTPPLIRKNKEKFSKELCIER